MLKAYRVEQYVVFAARGTEAKLLAAPMIKDNDAWKLDVAGWVALRAERAPELDDQVDRGATEPYLMK